MAEGSGYCVHCRANRRMHGGSLHVASNGRRYMKGGCASCGGRMASFVKGAAVHRHVPKIRGRKGKGIGDLLGLFL